MYQVLLPGDTFSRRVPDIYFTLSLRPYTDPSTAYTNFSVAWPILALVGPVAAATSLLAIPFVALAAGGTALASLTGFGAAVVDGTAAAVGIAASSTKTAASLAAKASVVPGGKKVRGKLIDAANSYKEVAQELVRVQVVRYFAKGDAAILPADAAVHRSAARAKRLAEVLVEVDVTGLDMEKVLRCKTGKKTTDANLGLAFKKLVMKFKDWQPKDNPCLRIVGGPELVERGSKTFLVFHPLVLEEIPHLVVEVRSSPACTLLMCCTQAIPLNELEPTEAETTLLNDAVLAKDMAQAEKLGEKAPLYGNGGEPTWAEEGAKKDGVAKKQ